LKKNEEEKTEEEEKFEFLKIPHFCEEEDVKIKLALSSSPHIRRWCAVGSCVV